jgi:acrylyl-CoA reductase (NADPH)/3-hydroxypropionyl-CoA dehydratase/3-hydroxypropionyl-CoA synthetase
LSRKEDVAAVIFTGSGSASFVAGADIRQMLEEVNTVSEAMALPNNAQLAFAKIEAMGKPCIAAIQGVALGGGMEFALACHYRIAEPHRALWPAGDQSAAAARLWRHAAPAALARRPQPETGLRDALDLILGGRAIDAEWRWRWARSTQLTEGADDALSLAHAAVRDFVRDGADSALGQAFAERQAATSAGKVRARPISTLRSATPSSNAFLGS